MLNRQEWSACFWVGGYCFYMKYYCIRQHDQRDCGAACVATIARDYGLKMPLAYYRNLTKTDGNGTNLFGIVAALSQIGFKSEAFETTTDELLKLKKEQFPMIVRIINSDNLYHFVVLNKITHKKVYLSDPGKGRSSIRIDVFKDIFTGHIVTVALEQDISIKKTSSKTTHFFVELLKHNKTIIFLICFSSLLLSLLGVFFSFIIRYEFETLENKAQLEAEGITFDLDELLEIHESGKLSEVEYTYYYYLIENVNWIKDNFYQIVILLGLVVLMQGIFSYLRQRLYIRLNAKFDTTIISTITEKILHLNQSHLDRWKSGDLIVRYSDAAVVSDSIISVSISLVLDVFMVIFGGVILFQQSDILFYIICSLVLMYVLIVFAYVRPIQNANLKELEASTVQSSSVKEMVDSIFDIKRNGAEDYHKHRLDDILNKYIQKFIRARRIETSQQMLITFSSGISNVLLLIASFYLIVEGKMMIATYITFMSLVDYFVDPIENLVNLQGTIQNGLVSLKRLSDVLDDENEDEEGTKRELYLKDCIAVNQVTFRYGYRQAIIEDYSIKIPVGKHTVISGINGCGKSTLVKLVAGIYDFESGDILFDDMPIREIDKEILNQNITYISQNSTLLSISVKDNILFGKDDKNDSLYELLDIVEMRQYVEKLPQGINTVLEERGKDLSSGQIQRLAIARALIRNPQILILDEATSNIDQLAEERIYCNIRNAYPEITIISIMHKVNPQITVDYVIQM